MVDRYSRAKELATKVVKLIDFQVSIERPLYCRKCHDVAIYRYPDTMALKLIQCDVCYTTGKMSDQIPKSEVYT